MLKIGSNRSYKILLVVIIAMFTNSNLFSYEEGVAINNDLEIYYRDYGPAEGDPILLVQGIGGQLINWPQHLIEFLIDNNFRPIVFELIFAFETSSKLISNPKTSESTNMYAPKQCLP